MTRGTGGVIRPGETADATSPAAPAPAPTPAKKRRKLGDFELIEKIGQGGMGVVYKAEQLSMRRVVALKILPALGGMDDAATVRFAREAEAAGRLAHPGIVSVFGVGEHAGIRFYAMEFVDGPSLELVLGCLRDRAPERLRESLLVEAGFGHLKLADHSDAGSPSAGSYVHSCVSIAMDVAEALAVAHRARIVHRDLKPGNVLIHPAGRAVLVDFGLARDELDLGLTRGEALGTPQYMAPEQATGRDIDARVDVYGFGALLYELLTLRPPFEGATIADIVRNLVDVEPIPLRKRNPRVPVDVETIVHRCLAKHPDDRYPAIETVAQDLRSYLAGQNIVARRAGLWGGLRRTLRHQRRHASVVLATIACTGVVAILATALFARRAESEGLALLEEARRALVERRALAHATELYGRARQLLDDSPQFFDVRAVHMREVFEAWYPEDIPLLRSLIGALTPYERSLLDDAIERIQGHGRLTLELPDGIEHERTRVRYRAVRNAASDEPWQDLPPSGRLPIGHYFLRITHPGRRAEVHHADVRRDAETSVAARLWAAHEIGDGMAPVVDPTSGAWAAVALTELSRRRYRELLDEIDDHDLRAEMVPLGWAARAGDPDELPVRGLSFRQARLAAAMLGGHLPSAREWWLAATAGAEQRRYPWGDAFEPSRVAADPYNLSAPEPVDGRPEGASPHGVLHLFGNVAEVLGRDADGSVWIAGGHFHSADAASMTLDDPRRVRVGLDGPDAASPYVGMRVCRFLTPEDTDTVRQVEDRRRELFASTTGSLVHDWTVRRDGRVDYQLAITGFHVTNDARLRLPLVTTGFIQESEPRLVDAHRRVLAANVVFGPRRESSEMTGSWPGPRRRGQRYRLHAELALLPTTGLRATGDGYVLRLPMKAAGVVPVLHRVVLPVSARVDSVEPPPTVIHHVDGAPHLIWEFPAGDATRVLPAIVGFRADGLLTDAWPSRHSVEAFVAGLCDDAKNGARRALHERRHPSCPDLDDALGSWAAHDSPEIVDATAVGPVLTVDLNAPWAVIGRDGTDFVVPRWRLQLQLLRTDSSLLLLRCAPSSTPDSGSIGADGTYRHGGLRVSIHIGQSHAALHRTQDDLTEMQILVVHPDDMGIRVQVLGHYGAEAESRDAVDARLTSGISATRRREALNRSGIGSIGKAGKQTAGRSLEWMFFDESQATRERWLFVTRGRRHLLVRAIANGVDAEQASRRFDRAREWFDSIAESVVFE